MAFENKLKEIKEKVEYKSGMTTVDKGRKFLEYILINIFDKTEEELNTYDLNDGVLIPDGANDKGIDAAFVDYDTLYLIQSKYGTSHNKEQVAAFYDKIIKFIGAKPNQLCDDLKKIREIIKDKSNDVMYIKVFYITNNELSYESDKHDYDSYSDKIEKIKEEGKMYSFSVIGIEKFNEIKISMTLQLPKEIRNKKARFMFENVMENKEKNTLVCEMKIKELAKIIHKNKDYIFFSNIRNFLGKNKTNNLEIANTFKNNPKDFWFYNNGITIVCDNYSVAYSGINLYDVTAPQIVNGCQTSSVIELCYYELPTEEQQNSQEGTILVKIIKDPNDKKRKNITKYTNSQTAVTGKDFFALEDFHHILQKSFENYGYNYEIQRGSNREKKKKFNGTNKYSHLFNTKFQSTYTFPAKDVVQYYVCAFHEKPAKAKNIGNFMPGGINYSQIFNEKTPEDARYYIFPFAVYQKFKNFNENELPKKIDKNKWSQSLLYLVYIFFQCVKIKLFNEKHNIFDEDYINELEKIFTSQDMFNEYIDMTKNVIDDLYKDTTIKGSIGDNLPKFLKSTIESNNEIKEILFDKINDNI